MAVPPGAHISRRCRSASWAPSPVRQFEIEFLDSGVDAFDCRFGGLTVTSIFLR